MKRFISNYFAWFFTILVLGGAVLMYMRNDAVRNSQLGDFISGIAATLAFLWLIVGYFLQNKELRLQREELRMQRDSLNLQKEEITE